jgi:hypothetical protein
MRRSRASGVTDFQEDLRLRIIAVVLSAFTGLAATATCSHAVVSSNREAIPPLAPRYATSSAAIALVPVTATTDEAASLFIRSLAAGDGSGGMKSYLPVLYSLVVPGLGEIALGHYYRGAALVAAEAIAWTSYAHFRNKGLDGRDTFEAYADAHWNYTEWIARHPATAEMVQGTGGDPYAVTFAELDLYGRTTWGSQWPGYHTYAAKGDEKLNSYENIGKYDWFISGWDDWDSSTRPMSTANRTTYRGLRKQSNDDLDTADKFIFLSIAARVYSVVETVILVRSSREDLGAAQARPERSYAFTARSTGLTAGEFALEFRFR